MVQSTCENILIYDAFCIYEPCVVVFKTIYKVELVDLTLLHVLAPWDYRFRMTEDHVIPSLQVMNLIYLIVIEQRELHSKSLLGDHLFPSVDAVGIGRRSRHGRDRISY